jgi:hypothetical protein
MANKSKKQINRNLWSIKGTDMFSKSEMTEMIELFSRRTSIFALYSEEPEPVFVRGQYLYI